MYISLVWAISPTLPMLLDVIKGMAIWLSYIITQRLLGVCSSSAIFSGIEIGKIQGCHSSRGERQVKEVKQ